MVGCALVCAHPGLDRQIEDLNARIALSPNEPALLLRRGELFRLHQSWELAEADFRKARKVDPTLSEVDFHLGQLRFSAGRFADADRLLTKFLTAQPGQASALETRARTRIALGKHLEAARDLTQAIDRLTELEIRPKPSHYLERARALEAAGAQHRPAALQGINEGLALLGQPVTLQLEAIEIELRLGRTDAALKRLQAQAARSNRQESWLLKIAEIQEQAGRPGPARANYRKALESIDALPESRRWNRATVQLEEQARSGLARLSTADVSLKEEPGE